MPVYSYPPVPFPSSRPREGPSCTTIVKWKLLLEPPLLPFLVTSAPSSSWLGAAESTRFDISTFLVWAGRWDLIWVLLSVNDVEVNFFPFNRNPSVNSINLPLHLFLQTRDHLSPSSRWISYPGPINHKRFCYSGGCFTINILSVIQLCCLGPSYVLLVLLLHWK